MNQDKNITKPYLIEGGISFDDRGNVSFVNDFHFEGVKRFYMVSNHKADFIRAWHAHRHESKYTMVVQGSAIVAAVLIDNWEKPAKNAEICRYVLSSQKPSILYIPPGYANGFMSLTIDATLIFYSTSTIEESRNDDIRYDSRYWDAWQVIER
jgi:dTDP-4-dehydrorhamnose 3,5-epimerase